MLFYLWNKKKKKWKRRGSLFLAAYCNVPSCRRNTKLMQSQPLLLHPKNAPCSWPSTMTMDFNCLWLTDSDMKLLKTSCYTFCAEMQGFASCWEGENPKHSPLEPPFQQSLEFCPEALWARKEIENFLLIPISARLNGSSLCCECRTMVKAKADIQLRGEGGPSGALTPVNNFGDVYGVTCCFLVWHYNDAIVKHSFYWQFFLFFSWLLPKIVKQLEKMAEKEKRQNRQGRYMVYQSSWLMHRSGLM